MSIPCSLLAAMEAMLAWNYLSSEYSCYQHLASLLLHLASYIFQYLWRRLSVSHIILFVHKYKFATNKHTICHDFWSKKFTRCYQYN